MKKRSNLQIMLKLSQLVMPLSGYMCLAVLMGILGNLCAAFIAVLGGYGILKVLWPQNSGGLVHIILLGAGFALLRGALRYGEQACNHFIAFKLLALIRDKVFGALRKLCPAKLEGRDKGDLISVITADIELLEVFYAHTISPCVIAFFFSLVMGGYLGLFHPIYGMIALAAYGIIGVVIPIAVSRLGGSDGEKFRKGAGGLSSFVLDSLRGLQEIIQFGAGEKRLFQMKLQTGELAGTEERMKTKLANNMGATNTIIWFLDIIMLFAAMELYQQGLVEFDGVLLPMLAFMGSFGPVIALASLGSTLGNTFAAGNRVLDILEEEPAVGEITGKKEIAFGDVQAEKVSFAYKNTPILEDFTLSIPRGQIVGITGKSGSGKSTFLKLLMRFWEIQDGRISISDRDIKEINTQELRELESFVTQETHLFSDSILNNLRVAREEASLEEIYQACKKASVHEVIMGFPKGYDTPVGELGDTLSGGERQRIGLARAFLHQGELMLLDEPTSNLDSLNEGVILKSLKEACQNKTVVLVSHRKSTMGITDVSYCVEFGRMS